MKVQARTKKSEPQRKTRSASKPAALKKGAKEKSLRPSDQVPSSADRKEQVRKPSAAIAKKPDQAPGPVQRPKENPLSAPRSSKKPKKTKTAESGRPARTAGAARKTSTLAPDAEAAERAQRGVLEVDAAKTKKVPKAEKKDKSDSSDKALIKFDPLQRYLSEISKYRLLTRDEEREYGLRVREQGDKDAAYALVTANLRLVVKIALEFQRVWMQNLLDLIQEGNIGLMQAVKKFDPYKNVKFSYYASFWIKAYILKFIMDNWRLVKIGTTQGQRKLFFKLKKEKQHLIDQGFDPKPKLLSERLGVSEREIVDMDQRLDSWDVSLDAPLKNDSETERIEFLSTDNESVEEQVSKKEIELLLHNKISEFRKKMTSREIEIFELRIFSDNPVTLQEIGDRYGISRERVRQVEKNIIRKMREFFKREIPDFASYAEDTGME